MLNWYLCITQGIICIYKSFSYAYILEGTKRLLYFLLPSYKSILFTMATFAVFNHPAPPPSFLSKSHQFHVGAHLSHGEVTRVTGAKWTQLWSGEEVSSLAVFLTPGTGLEAGM